MENNGWEKIIKAYYKECCDALDSAEKKHDADKRSVRKREIYQYCFSQVEAVEILMANLGIDYEEEEV